MSANTPEHLPRPGMLMPAKRVAEICQLSVSEIYHAHTAEMGSPGHFIYPVGATQQSYTIEGLLALVDGLRNAGYDLEAGVLRIEVERLRGMQPLPTPAPERVVVAAPERRPRRWRKSWITEHEHRQEDAA